MSQGDRLNGKVNNYVCIIMCDTIYREAFNGLILYNIPFLFFFISMCNINDIKIVVSIMISKLTIATTARTIKR